MAYCNIITGFVVFCIVTTATSSSPHRYRYAQGGVHHKYDQRSPHGAQPHGDSPPWSSQHHNYYGSVNYHHGNTEQDRRHHWKHGQEDRTWRFQVGGDYGAYEYLDTDGVLKGFHVDLILAVCGAAGKRCHYVMDKYSHCWVADDEGQFPGKGLLDGYYDACVGLFVSPERLNSFNFTVPFSPNDKAALLVRNDDSTNYKKDLTGKTLGFMDGWANSNHCLNRQFGIKGLTEYNSKFFTKHENMVKALKAGTVDIIMTSTTLDPAPLGLRRIEPKFACTSQGSSLMAHYGSELITWWNTAFNQFVASGQFARLCNKAKQTHGYRGPLLCV